MAEAAAAAAAAPVAVAVAEAGGAESAAARGARILVAEGTCATQVAAAGGAAVIEAAVVRPAGAASTDFAEDLVGSWEAEPTSACLPYTGASEVAAAGGAEEAGTGTGLADGWSYAVYWTCWVGPAGCRLRVGACKHSRWRAAV